MNKNNRGFTGTSNYSSVIILAYLWISTESAHRVPSAGSTLILGNREIIRKRHNSSPPRALLQALLEEGLVKPASLVTLSRFMER